jgi:hypothetical protein
MVWLFPGGGLEQALLAPPPPSVMEYETQGFGMSQAIRDMPVDWPIVVSNICDADHGLFAHQAKPFDLYSASKEYPFQVTEEFPNDGQGWILKTQVDATEKLLKVDRSFRGATKKGSVKQQQEQETPMATSYLYAPFHLQLKRVTKDTNTTSFVTAFYICPVGVGRTRFMSAGLSKKPPKRWLVKLFLDNFLDQDTYLLATQQQNILSEEAQDIRDMIQQERRPTAKIEDKTMSTRRKLFCLSSPSDKAGAKIEQFWDATLLRVPNRVQTLLKLDSAGAFRQTPSRQVVLDRKSQHLNICPDAQDVVHNCQRVIRVANAYSLVLVAAKVLTTYKIQRWNALLKPSVLAASLLVSSLASWVARRIKKEYFFKYTDEFRRQDMSNIPKTIWLDKEKRE